jgi:hypothetical protein
MHQGNSILKMAAINQPRPQNSNLRFGGVWLFWLLKIRVNQ